MILEVKVKGLIFTRLRIQSKEFGYYTKIYRFQEDFGFEEF